MLYSRTVCGMVDLDKGFALFIPSALAEVMRQGVAVDNFNGNAT